MHKSTPHTALCPMSLSLKLGRILHSVLQARGYARNRIDRTVNIYYGSLRNFGRDAVLHFVRFCSESSNAYPISRMSSALGLSKELRSLKLCVNIMIQVLTKCSMPSRTSSCENIQTECKDKRKDCSDGKPAFVNSQDSEKSSESSSTTVHGDSPLAGVLPETLGVATLLGVSILKQSKKVSTDRGEHTAELLQFSRSIGQPLPFRKEVSRQPLTAQQATLQCAMKDVEIPDMESQDIPVPTTSGPVDEKAAVHEAAEVASPSKNPNTRRSRRLQGKPPVTTGTIADNNVYAQRRAWMRGEITEQQLKEWEDDYALKKLERRLRAQEQEKRKKEKVAKTAPVKVKTESPTTERSVVPERTVLKAVKPRKKPTVVRFKDADFG